MEKETSDRASILPLNAPKLAERVFILCLIFSASCPQVTSPIALFTGIVFAIVFGGAFSDFTKKTQKFLLQASVVGLGFGMDLNSALKAGKDGMLLTIGSVILVMVLGYVLGRVLKLDRKTSYLVSAGTAICGGSAIAAVGPIVDAEDKQMSVSLGTIFVLNAVALFLFPWLGMKLGFDQTHFGEWAAIAIHDTSSVVGAGTAFDTAYAQASTLPLENPNLAFQTATLVKCTRALWILPLAFVTMSLFHKKGQKVSVPWFIFLFAGAMVINTYAGISATTSKTIVEVAKRGIALTLFLIGTGLNAKTLKSCGVKPFIQGVLLWIAIGVLSFIVCK